LRLPLLLLFGGGVALGVHSKFADTHSLAQILGLFGPLAGLALWLWTKGQVGAGAVAAIDLVGAVRSGTSRRIVRIVGWNLAYPALVAAVVFFMKPGQLPLIAQIALALALVVPLVADVHDRLAVDLVAAAAGGVCVPMSSGQEKAVATGHPLDKVDP